MYDPHGLLDRIDQNVLPILLIGGAAMLANYVLYNPHDLLERVDQNARS